MARFWNRWFNDDEDAENEQLIDEIMRRLETIETATTGIEQDATALQTRTESIRNDIRKVGKTQFKANTLMEGQSVRWEKAAEQLAEAQTKNTRFVEQLHTQSNATARHDLLLALLPVLDGIDQAFLSGYRYLYKRDLDVVLRDVWPDEQSPLGSTQDRSALAGWLDGLVVVRERLLTLLAADDVLRIPTVGLPFDPYLHVAVGSVSAETPAEHNLIAQEQKAGYRSASSILRYADVIVQNYVELL